MRRHIFDWKRPGSETITFGLELPGRLPEVGDVIEVTPSNLVLPSEEMLPKELHWARFKVVKVVPDSQIPRYVVQLDT